MTLSDALGVDDHVDLLTVHLNLEAALDRIALDDADATMWLNDAVSVLGQRWPELAEEGVEFELPEASLGEYLRTAKERLIALEERTPTLLVGRITDSLSRAMAQMGGVA